MQNKKGVKPMENICENDKTWIIFYFGAQNDPEIRPLVPILNTPLKVAQIDM